jgi:hypothetical protein
MPAWAWVLIVVAALAIVAVVTVKALRDHRSKTLRERFGPEYDRTLEGGESKKDAEAELAARAERRDKLEIRPLPTAARDRYLGEWQSVQARFVDDPEGAVRDADLLIQSVMRDRGYPMDDFEQRAADVSVDHPQVVENYRQGHKLARASALGEGTTEDLRQAMQHYRSLFDELVEQTTDAPLSRDDTAAERVRDEEAVR